jgi:hypothetical protein
MPLAAANRDAQVRRKSRFQRSGLGDREVFQRYFRQAYEHGYADGYAGY